MGEASWVLTTTAEFIQDKTWIGTTFGGLWPFSFHKGQGTWAITYSSSCIEAHATTECSFPVSKSSKTRYLWHQNFISIFVILKSPNSRWFAIVASNWSPSTHTLASPQLRTSPASSPSHSLAPVTNMASATASTEATLQDMQDTVLPDLTDPLKERLEEHELWLGMTWSFEAFEALPVHDDKWLCAIIPILHWQLWTWYEMLYCKFLITELHITNSTFQLSCIYNILIYLIYLCIYIYI